MAKSQKKIPKKAAVKKTKHLERAALAALTTNLSAATDVTITFTSGLGQATASLFRKGLLINMQSISMSGVIHFSDVQPGDVVGINGVCTGSATININSITVPATPTNFGAGPFNVIYGVLG